jgi:hypothetical protein
MDRLVRYNGSVPFRTFLTVPWITAMTPPNRFWPLYDDQEVEIYDNPFWDLPGRTRQPRKGEARGSERGIEPRA